MNKKEIESRISSAVSDMLPENSFEKLSQNINPAEYIERTRITMTTRKNNVLKFALPAAVACAVLVISLFGFSYYSNNLAVDSVIDIDVNPAIEITTNKANKVLKVEALNDEALEVIDSMELKDSSIKVAVNAIIGSMVQKGYFENADGGVLVSVKNNDNSKAEKIRKAIVADIDASLKGYKLDAAIINQTVSNTDKANTFAEKNNVSLGKAVLSLNLAEKTDKATAEELSKKSIKEIAKFVSDNKIDISDIVDYDADDSIWENLSDSIEEVDDKEDKEDEKEPSVSDQSKPTNDSSKPSQEVIKPESSTASEYISAKKAKEIALNHAKVKNPSFIKAKLDKEGKKYYYEIEFISGGYDYEYDINAKTGDIVFFDKEIIDDNELFDDDYIVSKPQETSSAQTSSAKLITSAKAKEIALDHAGLKDAAFERTELEKDDGIHKFEIEFKKDGYEYSYEINAVSGKVLSFDKEIDDDRPESRPASSQAASSNALIGEKQAKEIALNHAGLKDASFEKTELDEDDGIYKYEVEFKKNGVEYSYEIDAKTGKILSSEKEVDD